MRVNITDELKILKERFHLFESLGMFVLLVLLLSVVASLYTLVTGRELAREHQHQSIPENFLFHKNSKTKPKDSKLHRAISERSFHD